MVYQALPIIEIDINDLRLDLENYRIPVRPNDEAAALKYLFASEDVVGAAHMIVRDGYFDSEVPIVTSQPLGGTKAAYVVLEGNRRVAALKVLLDPSVCPEVDSEKKIRSLLKRYDIEASNLPRRIRVLVAQDRAEAEPHIARLHTGLSKRPWTLDQQANFYYSLLNSRTTVEDIRAQYSSVSVPRFIKMAVVRRLLIAVPFGDSSLSDYAKSDALKMSAFEYAYRRPEIAELVGIEFEKDGQLVPKESTPDQIGKALPAAMARALEYLLGEFRAGRLNTRSPEFKKDKDEHLDLLERLRLAGIGAHGSVQPNSSTGDSSLKGGTGAAGDRTSPSDGERQAGPSTSSDETARSADDRTERGPNHPDTKQRLSLGGLDYESAPVNLQIRFHELRKINIADLPTASAILMRSILETTIKVHFELAGSNATGQLAQVFKKVSERFQGDKALRQQIGIIGSGDADTPGSIQWFNLAAHGADVVVKPDQVRDAWKTINPVLRRLLTLPLAETEG